MKVALLVSNPYRDLPSQALTALELCQRGVTCYLVPGRLRNREIWPLAPDLVVLDNLRTGNEHLTEGMIRSGMRVLLADAEGGVFETLERYAAKLTPNAALRHAIGGYCAWGPAMAAHSVAAGWFTSQQVRVTGTPRFDFYADPWRDAALQHSRYAEEFSRPLVLIAGNFNRANPWFGTGERAVKVFVADGYGEDDMRRWLEVENGTMREMVELARRLAQAFPEATFVYRPHPFEKAETYEGQLSGLPNLHLVKRGTIEGWILRASAMIHRGSSTAIEASIAGVPAFSPSWIPAPVSYPAVDAVSVACSSEAELCQGIRCAIQGSSATPDHVRRGLETVLSQWFSAIDGLAHRRVADAAMDCLATGRVSLGACRDAMDNLDNRETTWRERGRARARRLLRSSPFWRLRRSETGESAWDRSERYFGVPEVQAAVNALKPAAARICVKAWQDVTVEAARPSRDYHFHYHGGRAVRIAPLPAG